MGADVTFCYRVSLEEAIRRAGLRVRGVSMPLEEAFDGISAMDDLVRVFADRLPGAHRALRELLRGHDVVMVAPGGKFTEGFNNPRALVTSALALSLGKPVIVLHQSVGPIDNPDHRKLVTEVFARSTLCLIRDDLSLKFLLELGVPPAKLVRCRDVAMGERYPQPSSPDFDLGVNIRRGFTGKVSLEALSRCILRYHEQRPHSRVLVYSTTWNLSRDVTDHVSSLPCEVAATMPSYPAYLGEVGRCAVNISDSMHGTLFSMMADRPVICCQTDFRTWKLEGIHEPGQEPLTILPGLVGERDADAVLAAVLAAERDPVPLLEVQRRIARYGRELCEEGWAAVGRALSSDGIRGNRFSRFFRRMSGQA
jgi:hypothetical protein